MSTAKADSIVTLLEEDRLLDYGSQIPVSLLEKMLGFKRNEQEFAWLVSMVRRALYEKGRYLSGEGVTASGFYQILPASENFYIGKLAMARAERDLEGKQVLLLNTPLDGLTQVQRQRHENTLRVISLRLSALRKVKEHNKQLAQKKQEIIDGLSEEE